MNEKNLNYETAELDSSMVEKIKTFESEINKHLDEDVVVVAYQKKTH